jgi:hypothetical protein
MKRFLPLLCSLAFAVCSLHAQYGAPKDADEDQPPQAPEEIPDFHNLDEYIYQPKSTLEYGMRFMPGPKISFGGMGNIAAPEQIQDDTTPNINRTYHDGEVEPDQRSLNVGSGSGTGTVPVAPDGKTNTWTYIDPSQLTANDYMQFHIYSAEIPSITPFQKAGQAALGAEVFDSMDMGKIGKHMKWSLFAGGSLSDIRAATFGNVNANLQTVTDTYDLFGQTPPAVVSGGTPYVSPGSTTQTVVQPGGGSQSGSQDTTTLIGNAPINRTDSGFPGQTLDQTTVTDHFKVSGAYFTFRGGPELEYDFTDHLKMSISVGADLIYAGTSYTTTELLQPPLGPSIVDIISDGVSVFRVGEYADATLEYDVTDTTGFYLGTFYQNSRGYTQHIYDGQGSDYTTTVDLSNQQGIRTGMTYRF